MQKFKKSLAVLPLTISLLLAGCGKEQSVTTQTNIEPNQSSTYHSTQSNQQNVKEIADRVANWQIEQLGNLDYIPESHRAKSENAKFWIQAAFYIGLTRWTETTKNQSFLGFMEKVAEQENFELLMDRPFHADDHTIAQTYIWLAEQTKNKDAIKPTQAVFDMILDNKPNVGLEMLDETASGSGKVHLEGNCQLRWCWADALFMAPRAWFQMTNITGDSKYAEYADKEFWASADYLFSDKYGLFFRDSRYFDMKSDNGEPVFWGRGNGWVFAAIPLIIDELPDDHPSKPRYIELYKKNAAGLIKLQTENGYWPASLLDPNKVKTPEVSGTGFITFGLAWGVNNGILTDENAKQAVRKGWSAITQAIEPSGRVNWVQHVGKSPDPVKKTDSQLYGVGAVLLAASEMIKWTD
ncbi:glycoside hydrolase family 88 protein [Aliiglaciecola sp. 3_MG-2023]|uniref:glycoside hydrolase family 88/105 protein n=1 Tax=Aliiglaciecola sp. 3_MG-2023 TaxID=3062644 RepID=UPI0026E14C57|nr:glycoside hydrolase family 88 protein [Aliiglaciecola sp. 3_MG-2023]MDO6693306.1 glycoside hydrolase family 88 protein [Aliiglaciecola sp. 3_MG-2023]